MDADSDAIDPTEDFPWVPAGELFRRVGFEPLPPLALDDSQLRGRLWEFIYAMAGRRFYLCHTDHVTDRELYTWLYEEWLREDVADIPPEAETNCHIDITDFNNGLDPIIWLRYFATEEERDAFARENNLKSIPAHEDPPCDRDRWLPEAPSIVDTDDFDDDDLLPLDDEPNEKSDFDESDPLGLAAADAAIHAAKLNDEDPLDESMPPAGTQPAEGWRRPIDQLKQTGASLVPPDELTDETLTANLWELLHNLACRGFYILHTNHLDDRQLYTELWQRGLRDEALLPGKIKTGGWYHDCIGSGSEEDQEIWLRYFASDAERAEHARQWPNVPLPKKEKPPFNRDWRLPKGPF